MDKFKIKMVPDWKIIMGMVLNVVGMTAIIITIFFLSSCDDNIFIAGYNKDMETIHQQMFEVDSLLMRVQLDLDSLNAKGN